MYRWSFVFFVRVCGQKGIKGKLRFCKGEKKVICLMNFMRN